MNEFDGNFEMVDPEDIHIDRKYQRDQKWGLISEIAADAAWVAFGVVICAKREYAGGLLYALDGQQRLTGVMTTTDPPQRVPVIWFAVKTPREEAAYFDVINTHRRQVASLDRYKARLTAKNPAYVQIASAVERAGYVIGQSNDSPLTISAVDSLKKVRDVAGEEGVYVGLVSYREAWPDEDAPTASMLILLADVMADMRVNGGANGGLNGEQLAKACSRTTPIRLKRRAEKIYHERGGSKRSALRQAFKELAKL